MKKIENLTNQYSVSKTLRFQLKPIGETEKYFSFKRYLEKDEKLASDYQTMKKEIIKYHRWFIDDCLASMELEQLGECYNLYEKATKTEEEKGRISLIKSKMKDAIYTKILSDDRYKKIFGEKMITEILPEFSGESEHEMISSFKRFTTYFVGFNDNIKNIYTNEGHSTEITYRLIDQNLNKFFDNCKIGRSLQEKMPEQLKEIEESLGQKIPFEKISDIFEPEYFNRTLTQKGIDLYNQIIGGYSFEDGRKVKGINEYINEYNQIEKEKLPKFKQLYKQILSERSTLSFLPEKFESDEALLKAIQQYYGVLNESVDAFSGLFYDSEYNDSLIYINALDLATVSQKIFGEWDTIREYFYAQYDASHTDKQKADFEKYENKRREYFKGIKYYCLADIFGVVEKPKFIEYINQAVKDTVERIKNAYAVLRKTDPSEKILGDEKNTEKVKEFLDAVKDLKELLGMFNVNTDDLKDTMFYGIYDEHYGVLSDCVSIYNKARNYLTQKVYSDTKIKLNFENAQLFNGWDVDKERDYQTILLRKGKNYYVGIIDAEDKKIFERAPKEVGTENCYEKMIYKLLPGPNKMLPKVIFAKSNEKLFTPPKEIVDKYLIGTHKSGPKFNKDDCHRLIDFFKECIRKYESWKTFDFHFSDTSTYETISDFYKEVSQQGYKVEFVNVPDSYIDQCISSGKLYLFQIYNKDFSEYSKGKKNLHTIYFEQIFSEENLSAPVFLLNGGAEMFYRFASPRLDPNHITHPKNQPIKNKNPLSEKSESVFAYDLIKDKRYTRAQFSLHIPIKMNAFAGDDYKNKLNGVVRREIRSCESNYVIGIDRGERNLLYVSVIDKNGKIVEQFSGNIIENEYNDNLYRTDYHKLLDVRETERDLARKSWKSINSIADLKKGYLSQIVHKICLLIEKYDAVIAMEDLNGGFKNSRKKFEKSVYQEFEKQLIEKLNFLVFKEKKENEAGGIRNAYQLTDKFESFQDMKFQNGIVFYIPAWNTSKIDPTTGFVNMLNTKYVSVNETKNFLKKFETIRYDKQNDLFRFSFRYSAFSGAKTDYKDAWTICSFGERIETFRNPAKNNQWDYRTVVPTDLLKTLFDKADISYDQGENLVDAVCNREDKDFYSALLHTLSLMLQMRNSNPNTDEDYILSPVENADGVFFDSRKYTPKDALPCDADANGAYHIAKKGLWAINQIKGASQEDYCKTSISISNKTWLEYIQTGN